MMDSLLKNFSPSTSSYEETFKTAYSHGLEEIYSLENIDITSIKPISVEPPKEQKPKPKRKAATQVSQLTFDFGGEFRETLPPFYLDEPIQMLALSKPLERNLMDQGKNAIGDLLKGEYKTYAQGHKDEINQRLENYLKGKEESRLADFHSLIKCLAGAQDRKRAKLSLDPYHLGGIFELTPLENMEIKRLSEERKKEWADDFFAKMAVKIPFARSKMSDIFDCFIKPWMRGRLGLATRMELLERLQRISENPESAEPTLKFLSSLNINCFEELLQQVDDDLYCVDRITQERFSQVVAKATTYFYKPHLRYALPELTLWLKREFALQWQGYDERFIEKSLRLSSQFRVRKGEEGVLFVKLS